MMSALDANLTPVDTTLPFARGNLSLSGSGMRLRGGGAGGNATVGGVGCLGRTTPRVTKTASFVRTMEASVATLAEHGFASIAQQYATEAAPTKETREDEGFLGKLTKCFAPSAADCDAELASAAAACIAAAAAAPCTRCGSRISAKFENTPWQCGACNQPLDQAALIAEAKREYKRQWGTGIIDREVALAAKVDMPTEEEQARTASRVIAEERALAAARAVDAPYRKKVWGGATVLTEEGKARHAARGVSVGFLKALLKSLDGTELEEPTTAQVANYLVKPATASRRCRFVELPSMADNVGKPIAFVSHTWGATFADLVSAIAHAVNDDSKCVWIDIFAVRQWPGNEADLDFECAVAAAPVFILVGRHVPEVKDMTNNEAAAKVVPAVAKKAVAFYRVWCLVELSVARTTGKPVIMLVGNGERKGDEATEERHWAFAPNTDMVTKLAHSLDITQASASVESDRKRILKEVKDGIGYHAIETLAVGALCGAEFGHTSQPVLAAVLGDRAPLDALCTQSGPDEPDENGKLPHLAGVAGGFVEAHNAMLAAAAGGFVEPLRMLLAAANHPMLALRLNLGYDTRANVINMMHKGTMQVGRLIGGEGHTALLLAARGGHAACVKELLEAGWDATWKTKDEGHNALHVAAQFGHLECVETILNHCGECIYLENKSGYLPVHLAAGLRESRVLQRLIAWAKKHPELVPGPRTGAEAYKNMVDYGRSQARSTPLHFASEAGSLACIKTLLEHGAAVNVASEKELGCYTPLHQCIEFRGDAECLQALIDAGANVNSRAVDGRTPLMIACMQRRPEMTLLLLQSEHTININDETCGGLTAPLFCMLDAEFPDVGSLELFMICGWDPVRQTSKGFSGMQIADHIRYTTRNPMFFNKLRDYHGFLRGGNNVYEHRDPYEIVAKYRSQLERRPAGTGKQYTYGEQ